MKYLLLFLLFIGCSEKLIIPKIGECYEYYTPNSSIAYYEYRKVIDITKTKDHYLIHYVFNMPHFTKFKKGKWYTLEDEISRVKGVEEFLEIELDFMVVNKIKCPW